MCVTTDLMEEEIELGLFSDPEMLGWMAVAMSLTDIAAVGGRPCGVLLQITLPEDRSPAWYHAFFTGANDCCVAHNTFILGGDTNLGRLRVGSCVVGKVAKPVSDPRRHLSIGHDLYVSGDIGIGNQIAYASVAGHPMHEQLVARFRPQVSFALGEMILSLGGGCIDTSDGLIPTLLTLLQCQQIPCGAALEIELPKQLSEFASSVGMPPEAFLLGEVGDYGLLFSAPPSQRSVIEEAFANAKMQVTRIGRVIEQQVIDLHTKDHYVWTLERLASQRGMGGTVQDRVQRIMDLFAV